MFSFLIIMQVLKAFHADVSNKLSRACAFRPALKVIEEKVQSSMNTLLSPKNYELLSDSLPARDVAFSLARIYMGMTLMILFFFRNFLMNCCSVRSQKLCGRRLRMWEKGGRIKSAPFFLSPPPPDRCAYSVTF